MAFRDNRVMLLKCDDYDVQLIKENIRRGLEPWGGLEAFVKPNQQVLLKANLIIAKKAEECATTHPAIVQAVAELVQELGAKAIIGDSPGGPFNESMMRRVYRKTGMEEVAKKAGADLNWNFDEIPSSFTGGEVLKNITLGRFISDADVIINLPKFKSHGLTKMTGGVKNMFGAVPGLLKAEYHMKMQEINDFANALMDIALVTKPNLTIMDGIIGMEGEGPTGGEAIKLNTILISPNPCVLDVVMAKIAKVDPLSIPTIKVAKKRGLVYQLEDIEILGEEVEEYSFVAPTIDNSAELLRMRLPAPIAKWVTSSLRPKPIFKENKCVQCGVCIQSCPPKIITKTGNCVEADLDKCIRCFCCQELCPKEAVDIHRPFLGRILFGK
ncbi:hypothetical protein U472_02405 [Orenia metallireducens]|uniref:Ferredoxin n=1 Tax=Orenia metallireducens TaxID=1413210 RepID=A0A1C0ACG3_9FIRM|nr:DUF362 domain-containing protein [Orenia metallireducens]OCL28070.1 hypothetical protein U472_02405 [Orenia metallireducens]